MTAVREAIVRAVLEYGAIFTCRSSPACCKRAGCATPRWPRSTRDADLGRGGHRAARTDLLGDEQRYEAAFERPHHDHLVCTKCNEVIEFHYEALEALQRDIAERYGYELTGHVHELLGRCPNAVNDHALSHIDSAVDVDRLTGDVPLRASKTAGAATSGHVTEATHRNELGACARVGAQHVGLR